MENETAVQFNKYQMNDVSCRPKEQPQVIHKPTSVYEGVFLHVRLLVEPFATVLAGIGPGV